MQTWMDEQIWKERWPRRLLKIFVIGAPFWTSQWVSAFAGEQWGVLTFIAVLIAVAMKVRSDWWVEAPSRQEPPIGPLF